MTNESKHETVSILLTCFCLNFAFVWKENSLQTKSQSVSFLSHYLTLQYVYVCCDNKIEQRVFFGHLLTYDWLNKVTFIFNQNQKSLKMIKKARKKDQNRSK